MRIIINLWLCFSFLYCIISIMYISDFVIIALGIVAGAFLLWRFPVIFPALIKNKPRISVVIPCRNEEINIGELLTQLNMQDYPPYEIICVNDQSDDRTKEIAHSLGARVIDIIERESGWLGKTNGMKEGAKVAQGDVLLFIDADVKLGVSALKTLASNYSSHGTISVQPYHKTGKIRESLALFFNIISVAGTGITLVKGKQRGMFGPIFMISKEEYDKNGGHSSVKDKVIEDFALGNYYAEKGFKYRLFIGNKDISFRMYPEGLRSQAEGFIKNISEGALAANLSTTLPTILLITSLTAIPIMIIRTAMSSSIPALILSISFYILALALIGRSAAKIGRFNPLAIIFYPLPLLWFHIIFFISLIRKVFFRSVTWKGRKIKV